MASAADSDGRRGRLPRLASARVSAGQLVPPAVLAAARARAAATGDPSIDALLARAREWEAQSPERLPAASHTSNLFAIQNCLIECALAWALTDDELHLRPLQAILAELTPERLALADLPEEIHLGFVGIGLALALDLAADALPAALADGARATIVRFAETLARDARAHE